MFQFYFCSSLHALSLGSVIFFLQVWFLMLTDIKITWHATRLLASWEKETPIGSSHGYGEPGASQVAPVVKNPPASAGDIRDAGLIPGLGRSPEEGNSNPFQYSCLENSTDREAWCAAVHGVAKIWTRFSVQRLNWTDTHFKKITQFMQIYTY